MPLSLEQLRSIQASPAVDGHAPLGIARIKLTALAKEGKLDEEDGSKIENTASASTGGSLGPGAARVRIRTAESTSRTVRQEFGGPTHFRTREHFCIRFVLIPPRPSRVLLTPPQLPVSLLFQESPSYMSLYAEDKVSAPSTPQALLPPAETNRVTLCRYSLPESSRVGPVGGRLRSCTDCDIRGAAVSFFRPITPSC